MGLLSGIFSFFQSIFKGILEFLKKYGLYILLIAIAIYVMNPVLFAAIVDWFAVAAASFSTWLGASWAALGTWLGSLTMTEVLIGAAALWVLEDPEGATEFVTDAVYGVTSALAGGVADGLGLKGLFAVAVGIGAWFFFSKGKDKNKVPVEEIDPDTGVPVRAEGAR